MTELVLEDAVYVRDERPLTNSLKIAEVFGKNHRDVMRAIRNKVRNHSKLFTERNFALSEYVDHGGKQNAMYEISKDGFVSIAFSFTGSQAVSFQESFIEEFNRRGEAIRNLNLALPKDRRKNRHSFGYHKLETTPDGKSRHTWVSGSKTLEEMDELEKHAWIQSKRIKQCLGNFKSFLAEMCERDRYQDSFIAILDQLDELTKKFSYKQRTPNLVQIPLFAEEQF